MARVLVGTTLEADKGNWQTIHDSKSKGSKLACGAVDRGGCEGVRKVLSTIVTAEYLVTPEYCSTDLQ